MRFLQILWLGWIWAWRYNPAELMEQLMVLCAITTAIIWGFNDRWPFLILSSSFALGAAASMLMREAINPSGQAKLVRLLGLILTLYSIHGFVELVQTYRLARILLRFLQV